MWRSWLVVVALILAAGGVLSAAVVLDGPTADPPTESDTETDNDRTATPLDGTERPAITPPEPGPEDTPETDQGEHEDTELPMSEAVESDGQERELDDQAEAAEEAGVRDHRRDVIAGLAGRSEEGFIVSPSVGAAGRGDEVTFTIEVDPDVPFHLADVADEVTDNLFDGRSWSADNHLIHVDDPALADIRILVAPPAVVDELCAEADLDTAGIYSCWNGRFAALNADRWADGVDTFTSIGQYRNYLVNHEFGHGLGHGHETCTNPGEPASVMLQQTKGLDGCTSNGWPYPR